MKIIALLIATLMILLGLTGIFWPEGVRELAKYSVIGTGIYVMAIVRVVVGALLFTAARAAVMPRTLRVIGAVIFAAGVGTFFLTPERGQRLIEWWTARGPDAFRIVACVPLVAGLLIGGATLFNPRKP
jgi:hypothetical protein